MIPVPAGYPIARLTGPIVVASWLHWGLFGTLSVQLYLYYLAFPNDRKFTKYLVYGVYVVELVQTILASHDAFRLFGYDYGNFEALTDMRLNWLTVPIMSALCACVGQLFYAYRIFILSKSRIIPIFVICVSLTSSVGAIITGVLAFQAPNYLALHNRKTNIAVGIWCGGSALCDVIIAVCMTYSLVRNSTGLRQTQILVTKLVRLIIETGTVTAAVALLNLNLFFALPDQSYYMAPALVMPKLYANAIYMVLNSRIRMVGGRDTYTSSIDMVISTSSTMLRDTNSYLPQASLGTGRRQGRASVVAIPSEALNGDCEMDQMNDKTIGSAA
ncbi:hypothetical protein F5146DRAFT_1220665 [Armillaria mellea]|nr:hypothetical protein F5146DRAFT_1220665 [Armillaria mellea]